MQRDLNLRSIDDLAVVREIRDPVYNYVHLSNFEDKVLDSWIFQRLDRIAQMPTAHLVYPGGKYSRKSHSLGVMHLMGKAILHILFLHSEELREEISPLLLGESVVLKNRNEKFDDLLDPEIKNNWWKSKELDELVQYARLAALLHDIGHAPFSHTFEAATEELVENGTIDYAFDHEEMSRRIVKEKEDQLGLEEPFKADEINEILDKRGGSAPDFLKGLIDGPCDCDKLDYLMRDSYHLGTPEYGKVDAERIIDGFRVKDLQIHISSSALHAMMNSFRAIQSMYTAIYYHKTSRAFDFMIVDALSLVPEFITEITSSVNRFLEYDDCTIVCAIEEKARGEDSSAKPYKKANEILEKVRKRKKTYEHILEFPLNFPLVAEEAIKTDINRVCKRIKELCEEHDAEDFNIRLDYRSAIKPIGINLGEIIKWLTSPIIYDTEDNEVKSLNEIYNAYYRELTRYSIIFRIFVNREKFKKHPSTVKKIKEEAKKELENLDTRWRTASS